MRSRASVMERDFWPGRMAAATRLQVSDQRSDVRSGATGDVLPLEEAAEEEEEW
jgi:hypothetical protein